MDEIPVQDAKPRDDLEIVSFADVASLRRWLAGAPEGRAAVWARLFKVGAHQPSVSFLELLEEGLAWGWSESSRQAYDADSYLQRFGPRRGRGTLSERNLRIVERLEAEGRMTDAGRRALRR